MLVDEFGSEVHYAVTGVANMVDPVREHEGSVPEGSLQFFWNQLLGMGGMVILIHFLY